MKTNKYIFILVTLCIFYLYLYNTNYTINRETLSVMGGVGLFQFIISFLSWNSAGKKILSPYFIFLFVLYIFSFGQSLLYPFGLVCEQRDLYERYSVMYGFTVNDIYLAQIQSLLMLNLFHIAGLQYSLKKTVENCNIVNKDKWNIATIQRLKKIGWFLFVVSVIPFTYETITDMITSMTYGYGALYEGEDKIGVANAISFISALFIPSVICLFIVYKSNVFIRNLLTGIIILVILAILMTGGRSNALILISILVVLYEYLIRPFSKKAILIGLIGAFFMLQVLAYIANTRGAARSFTIEKTEISDNAAVQAIAEMGWTQFCLIETMKLVPQQDDYRYGKSYIYAFTSIIPNLGFWKIHPAKTESNLGDWLSNSLQTNFGTGFSMCAEAWANWGSYGFLIFYLWGALLGSLFGRIETTIKNGNIALLVFLLIIFWFCLKIPRNSFLNVVRAVFFYAGPIYLYCNNFRLKKS